MLTLALTHMTDAWARAMDCGLLTGVLAVDLTKAFDCISHDAILNSLCSTFGLGGSALELVRDYLVDRRAMVVSGPHKSEFGHINTGVPQGSILGPILFITALTKIKDSIPSNMSYHIYADDTTVWISGGDPQEIRLALEQTGRALFECFASMGLKINSAKSQFMFVGGSSLLHRLPDLDEPLQFLNSQLQPQTSLKILGLIVDQTLNFDKHIEQLLKKCTSKIRFLWRTASKLPERCKLMLYSALVSPHLKYCDSVWMMSIRASYRKKLETVHNNGMRFIKDKKRDYSATALRREMNWTSLHNKRVIHYNSMTWMSVHGRAPSYMQEMFTRTDAVHSYNTRERLYVPRRRRAVSSRAFSLQAPL